MSTFESLVADLTRDAHRVQPKDALQFCANWFQSRLEEQRARTRDTLNQRSHSFSRDLPSDFYVDTPINMQGPPTTVSPFSQDIPNHRSSLPMRNNSISPFGTLNVAGNALLNDHSGGGNNHVKINVPTFNIDGHELPPTSPLTTANPFANFEGLSPNASNPGDYLHPANSAIFARRTSVSAESIIVDGSNTEPLPVYTKTPDQRRRIKASIANNFIFRDLDEEQEVGVLNAMQERKVGKNEVVIRQGDVGEYFYVVESGFLHCYIRPEPLPPTWLADKPPSSAETPPEKFLQPGYHPEYGRKVAECKPGNSFGELALMYGHPRAATVMTIEPSTLWQVDRTTFRTIILKAAHRRRTMYESLLSGVALLSSLEAEEKSKIADALVSRVYLDGQKVVVQGEAGDTFFFVEEGEAIATKVMKGDDGETKEVKVGHIKKGDYFGELALLDRRPRAATVSAIVRTDPSAPKLKVAALDAEAFTRLLGPLRELMERRAGERYGR